MAGSVPASHSFKGDGVTRVFPISSRIIGDDYVRIEIDSVYIFDRSSWDIVNNSIIFTVAPQLNSTVLVKVAESVEAVGLLDNQSTADIIEANIPVINNIYNDSPQLLEVHSNLPKIIGVDDNKTNINLLASNIGNVNVIANNLGDLSSIKNHNNLTGRESPNAHPMSAITGLEEVLDGLSNDGGLFPSVTSEYSTPDTYLSCKVSPTELRAVKLKDLHSMRYNNTPTTSTIYDNLHISEDVYGAFNTPYDFYASVKDKVYLYGTDTNYIQQLSKVRYTFKDPLDSRGYYLVYGGTIAKFRYNNTDTNIVIYSSANEIQTVVLTDNYKLVITFAIASAKVVVIDLYSRIATAVEGTEYLSSQYTDAQLHPNGKIYYAPAEASRILCIDPSSMTFEVYGDLPTTSFKYAKAFLGINGNIYMIPRYADHILEFNTTSSVITTWGSGELGSDFNKFLTGVVGFDGRIYMLPFNMLSSDLFIFNVNTKQIDKVDLAPVLSNNPLPGSPTIAKVDHMMLGVDGYIYVRRSDTLTTNVLTRTTDNYFSIKVNNDGTITRGFIGSLSTNTKPILAYSHGSEIVINYYRIINSNDGVNYWVMSNYFMKGIL